MSSGSGGETADSPSAWTPDLLYLYFIGRLNAVEEIAHTQVAASEKLTAHELLALSSKLDERYQTQTKALDAAFVAQQLAMTTAFTAADKAVAAALAAQEKAVDKANIANEKRFESVNEFRAQLNDMVNTLMPRQEAESRFLAIIEKLEMANTAISNMVPRTEMNARLGALIEKLDLVITRSGVTERAMSSRLDMSQGQSAGMRDFWGWIVGGIGVLGGIVALYFTLKG